MSSGIATPPVEGRIGALVIGADQGSGSLAYQAGIIGGTPTNAANTLSATNQAMRRVASATFVRTP